MSLYLVDPASGLSVELRVPESLHTAIAVQWDRLENCSARELFCKRLSDQLCSLLPEALDWDIKAPTNAQLAYALVLSKRFKVEIPEEARNYRSKMQEFIGLYAARLKEG